MAQKGLPEPEACWASSSPTQVFPHSSIITLTNIIPKQEAPDTFPAAAMFVIRHSSKLPFLLLDQVRSPNNRANNQNQIAAVPLSSNTAMLGMKAKRLTNPTKKMPYTPKVCSESNSILRIQKQIMFISCFRGASNPTQRLYQFCSIPKHHFLCPRSSLNSGLSGC